jgi:hypothetical protein
MANPFAYRNFLLLFTGIAATALAALTSYAQNQTPPNVPSPDAGLKQQLEGVWSADNEYDGKFDNTGGPFHAKRSFSCVLSGVGSADSFTARCHQTIDYTSPDEGGTFVREMEGTFRLTRQGREISGYADYARHRDAANQWEDYPAGSTIKGALSYSGQFSIRIDWTKSEWNGGTLQKR